MLFDVLIYSAFFVVFGLALVSVVTGDSIPEAVKRVTAWTTWGVGKAVAAFKAWKAKREADRA
jgi:hypothetical protein